MSTISSAKNGYMILLVVGLLMWSQIARARKLLASTQDETKLKIEHAVAPTASNDIKDEKNFIAYGGMGHYSGIGGFVGMGGLPIMHGGGIGGVGGVGGGIGNVGGLGGVGGGIAKGGALGGGGVGGGIVPHIP